MSSSFTDPNDSQNESENNFVASYMMEVEDDTVHGSVTTEVSGPEGESEDDEWVVKPYEDEPLADEDWVANYYEERRLEVQKLEMLRSRLDGRVTLERW